MKRLNSVPWKRLLQGHVLSILTWSFDLTSKTGQRLTQSSLIVIGLLPLNFFKVFSGLQHVCLLLSSTGSFVDSYTQKFSNQNINLHSSCHVLNQLLVPRPARPAVATPSCYGHVDEPLWGAPFPWCQPLPGWACTVGSTVKECWGEPDVVHPTKNMGRGCFPFQWYSGIFQHL